MSDLGLRRGGPAANVTADALLRVDGLSKTFPLRRTGPFRRGSGTISAVDNVTFSIARGETLGLVGESGSGKSTLARLIAGLVPASAGTVTFDGAQITGMSRRELRPIRRDLQMIFQDPYGSLNPRRRVGSIIGDPYAIHGAMPGAKRRRRVQELMEIVGLNPEHYNRFPAEFSGGQRQRIGIARALALKPKLLICDEPVSALDVSIQAQVINLLADLQREFGLTYLFIAHDLSVVRHVSTRVAVMHLGEIVEIADADELYERPRHPYTAALLSAAPRPDPTSAGQRRRVVLHGDLPSAADPPSGCRFHPRCPKAHPDCGVLHPKLAGLEPRRMVACLYPLANGERLTPAATQDVAGAPT